MKLNPAEDRHRPLTPACRKQCICTHTHTFDFLLFLLNPASFISYAFTCSSLCFGIGLFRVFLFSCYYFDTLQLLPLSSYLSFKCKLFPTITFLKPAIRSYWLIFFFTVFVPSFATFFSFLICNCLSSIFTFII